MDDQRFFPDPFLPPVVLNVLSAYGLSPDGMHEAAKQYLLSRIELDKHNATQAIDHYWAQQQTGSTPNASIPLAGRAPDLVALGIKFIADKSVVKIQSVDPRRGRFVHFVRDKHLNRHVIVTEDVLKLMFYDFVFDNTEDLSWDDEAAMRRAFRRMLHAIPLLSETHMTVLEPTKIVALDSIFDLQTGTLIPAIQYPQGLFNTSSIPLNLLTGNDATIAFDALLCDIFGDVEGQMTRAQEFIGKLISLLKTKNGFVVFQGVSNAGKTRLERLVVKHILQGAGIFVASDFSDLASDDLKRADSPYALVTVRDAVDKTVSPKQRAFIKSYVDNGNSTIEPTYTILACTNGAIFTGDNGFVERPLKNRCLVLPFPKPMDNTNPLVANFETLYLEHELPAIALKCLRAYAAVLQRGGEFSGHGELNEVIEATSETPQQELPEPDMKARLEQALDLCFELCDEADPAMTTANILDCLKRLDPTLEVSPETMGRVLRDHFGTNLVPKRLSTGMCYNIRRR